MLTPLEEQVVIALRQISQAIDLYSRYLLQEVGLTAPQLAVLRCIAAAEEMTPGGLADRLHLSPQTMTGILNRLEERQLVKRKQQTRDRRSFRVRITSAGRKAARSAPPLLRDRFRAELAELPKWEQTQILGTLQRIASMMNATDLAVEPFLDSSNALQRPTPRTPQCPT